MFWAIFRLMMSLWLWGEYDKHVARREEWERSIPEGSPFAPPVQMPPGDVPPVRRKPVNMKGKI